MARARYAVRVSRKYSRLDKCPISLPGRVSLSPSIGRSDNSKEIVESVIKCYPGVC